MWGYFFTAWNVGMINVWIKIKSLINKFEDRLQNICNLKINYEKVKHYF